MLSFFRLMFPAVAFGLLPLAGVACVAIIANLLKGINQRNIGHFCPIAKKRRHKTIILRVFFYT